MVSQVDHFDTIFVSSEFEALILENSLIKQHQPHYNILLKDDKGYPFVRLSHGPYAETKEELQEMAYGKSCATKPPVSLDSSGQRGTLSPLNTPDKGERCSLLESPCQ